MIFDDIEFSLPPGSFFDFPPSAEPQALPPPSHEPSIKAPFRIDPTVYNNALSPRIPITFALSYFAIVTLCNAINRRRRNRPFPISQTEPFKALVLLHNFALALYSGVTCAAMIRCLYVSVPSLFGEHGLAGTVDGLCKMNGPRGFGAAVTYNPASLTWASKDQLVHLGLDKLSPDATDVGRIWNEGLAFWGWFFYLSKYYEVVDTIIILLKGKRATTLQKYHHAGALLCMWAGMRYMSPPIWMFVLVNSGIHTLMYTFYTAATVGIRVPPAIKRTITSLQIMQFLVGLTFASAHLFISYRVPVSTPYSVWSAVAGAAKGAPSTVSGLLASTGLVSGSVELPAWLKRLAYRAAGAEGLAENVRDADGAFNLHRDAGRSPRRSFGDSRGPNSHGARDSSTHKAKSEMVRCLDTNGQAFAIWLNLVYLTPLTLLFARFFWKSYILGKPSVVARPAKGPRRLSESAEYAAKKTSDVFEEYGEEFEKSMGFTSDDNARNGAAKESKAIVENGGAEVRTANDIKAELEREGQEIVGSSASAKKAASGKGQQSEQLWFGGRSSSVRAKDTPTTNTSYLKASPTTEQQDSWTDVTKEGEPNLDEYLDKREERGEMDEQYIVELESKIVKEDGEVVVEETTTLVELADGEATDPSHGFGLGG